MLVRSSTGRPQLIGTAERERYLIHRALQVILMRPGCRLPDRGEWKQSGALDEDFDPYRSLLRWNDETLSAQTAT